MSEQKAEITAWVTCTVCKLNVKSLNSFAMCEECAKTHLNKTEIRHYSQLGVKPVLPFAPAPFSVSQESKDPEISESMKAAIRSDKTNAVLRLAKLIYDLTAQIEDHETQARSKGDELIEAKMALDKVLYG